MLDSNHGDGISAIVGIGASAGGLEALQSIFSHFDKHINDAVIIVAQHMSPNYKSKLVELLSRKTNIKIYSATNGTRLTPNTIYIIPPDFNAYIKNSTIALQKTNNVGPRPSIDYLFQSMVDSKDPSVKIGVVLSGTGKDGTEGMKYLQQMGGITIAQQPATAKYPGMPQSAISSGFVNYVFDPNEIGSTIADLANDPYMAIEKKSDISNDEFIKQLLALLANKVGVDFTGYKASTVLRRLEKSMLDVNIDSADEYLQYIQNKPQELDKLFRNLLIGVTSFFRDQESFKRLEEVVKQIVKKSESDKIRVWVPGCATGEEAYSIAIIFDQYLNNTRQSVQILATDIDEKALKIARKGIYSEDVLENVSQEFLARYFDKLKDGQFQIRKEVKKSVLFSKHDVITNPPFLKLDLVSCRNLLIYFDANLQQDVIPIFHYALKPDGYLFLGKSETIGDFSDRFYSYDARNKIYQKKETNGKASQLPFVRLFESKQQYSEANHSEKSQLSVSDMVKETLFQTFEYPYAIIDESFNLIEVSGNTNNLIFLKPGLASMNVLNLIHSDLQIELRTVAGTTIRNNEISKGHLKKVNLGDNSEVFIRVIAKPLLFTKSQNPMYLVIFEEVKMVDYVKFAPQETDTDLQQAREIEHELVITKERMNSLIEELETYNEELQATNEELQSSNEELHTSNEELETTNEELQSTYEELEIAYNELRSTTEELEKKSANLEKSEQNLQTVFNNTLQGFILVDRKYHILTFNKTAYEIYLNAYGKKIKTGDYYLDIIQSQELEQFHRSFKKALAGKLVSDKLFIESEAGQKIWLDYNFTPVYEDKNQQVEKVNISFIDSSKLQLLSDERDELLKELTEKNKELHLANQNFDNFFHIIAHDLRSPVGNLKMLANQFADADPEEWVELWPVFQQSVNRLENTITGLIKILEVDEKDAISSDIQPAEVIAEVMRELNEKINSTQAEIRLHHLDGKKINYIKEYLYSITKNMISNAIKYSQRNQPPEIDIWWEEDSTYQKLIVKDNGIGIDLKKFGNRLFTPFKRIDKNNQMGLGVGLHIVKTMVEKNGGKIHVESKPGDGTTFHIYLKEYPEVENA